MLTGELKPLEIAQRVLTPGIIQAVKRSPFFLRSWKILDRWALNNPDALRALEAQGEVVFLGRLLDQQTLEHELLMRDEVMAAKQGGVAEQELLAMHGVQTELN